MAGRASDKDLEILQILATIAHLVHILACMKQQIFNLFKKAGTRFIRDCTRLRDVSLTQTGEDVSIRFGSKWGSVIVRQHEVSRVGVQGMWTP